MGSEQISSRFMKKTKLQREIVEAKENFRRQANAVSFPEKVVVAFRMKEQEILIKKAHSLNKKV